VRAPWRGAASNDDDAGMAELVDAADLKSAGRKPIGVRAPVPARCSERS
jgi:hypothetical protein